MNILVLYSDDDKFVVGRSRYQIGQDTWWFASPKLIRKQPPFELTLNRIMVMCDMEVYYSIVGQLYNAYAPDIVIQEIEKDRSGG